MALDGMVIADMAYELNRDLTGGRIAKIAQPEKDELLLTIKEKRHCAVRSVLYFRSIRVFR